MSTQDGVFVLKSSPRERLWATLGSQIPSIVLGWLIKAVSCLKPTPGRSSLVSTPQEGGRVFQSSCSDGITWGLTLELGLLSTGYAFQGSSEKTTFYSRVKCLPRKLIAKAVSRWNLFQENDAHRGGRLISRGVMSRSSCLGCFCHVSPCPSLFKPALSWS